MDTKGGREGGMDGDTGIDIYMLLCIKQITNENRTAETNTTL